MNNNKDPNRIHLLDPTPAIQQKKSSGGNKGIRSINTIDRPRILLVDTQLLYLRGMHLILEETTEFELIQDSLTGQQALIQAELMLPDVILCSIKLPDVSGFEVCRTIRRRLPQTSVILLSDSDDDEELFLALKAGAAAYFEKNMSSARLVEIVQLVVKGEYLINQQVFLKPLVAKRVLNQFNELTTIEESDASHIFAPLTGREIAILDSIARGNTNKAIGLELIISDQTVKNHITNILRKLNANDRTQAVITGIRNGWINI